MSTLQHADDNAIYDSAESIDSISTCHYNNQQKRIFKWFSDNQMKGNTDKSYLIMSTDEQLQILVGDSSIKRSNCEKLLGVKTDSKRNFNYRVQTICGKTSNKLRPLASTA